MKPPIILLVLLLYHSYLIMKRNFEQIYTMNSKIEDSKHEVFLHSAAKKMESLTFHYKGNRYDSYLRNYRWRLQHSHGGNKSGHRSFLHNDKEHSKITSDSHREKKKKIQTVKQDTKHTGNDV